MAYVEFRTPADQPTGSTQGSRSPCDCESEPASRLGRQEWSIVEFARNESLWTLNPNGLLQRIGRTLFGIRQPMPLANPNLEALRRFALVAWHRGSVGAAQLREFVSAGFSCADASLVLQHVTRRRNIESWPNGMA
jgi:hypothetical protein